MASKTKLLNVIYIKVGLELLLKPLYRQELNILQSSRNQMNQNMGFEYLKFLRYKIVEVHLLLQTFCFLGSHLEVSIDYHTLDIAYHVQISVWNDERNNFDNSCIQILILEQI